MQSPSRCEVCKVDIPRECWASHVLGKKHQRAVLLLQPPSRCEVCKLDIPHECWASHVLGKKHQRAVLLLQQKREAEEKGIYVNGMCSILLWFLCT
jgi:hypothetical protein